MFAQYMAVFILGQYAVARALVLARDTKGETVSVHTGIEPRDRPPQIWLALGPGVAVMNVKTDWAIAGETYTGPGLIGLIGLGMNTAMAWNVDFERNGAKVREQCTVIKTDETKPQLDDRVFVIQSVEGAHAPISTNGPFNFVCAPAGFVSFVPPA